MRMDRDNLSEFLDSREVKKFWAAPSAREICCFICGARGKYQSYTWLMLCALLRCTHFLVHKKSAKCACFFDNFNLCYLLYLIPQVLQGRKFSKGALLYGVIPVCALCEAERPGHLNVRVVLRHCVPNKGLRSLAPLCGYPCRPTVNAGGHFLSKFFRRSFKSAKTENPIRIGSRTGSL